MSKTIVLSDTFFDSYNRLDERSKKSVRTSMKQLAVEEKGGGFQIHGIDKTKCDNSFRSARINQDLRVIFSHQGERYILLYVDHHDDAYGWAEGKYLKVSNFGALYIYDSQITLREPTEKVPAITENFDKPNFAKTLLEKQAITAKELIKLGINEIHAKILMRIDDENEFIEFITTYPEELQEALIDLTTGAKNMTQVYAELAAEREESSETDAIEQALNHKDTRRRFYAVEDSEQLERVLEGDFEKWRLFLHPSQKRLVQLNSKGPVLVEGGPGTGKTIVGIHRAIFLARSVYPKPEQKVLFCTFSRKLASYIKEKITALAGQNDLCSKIDVVGVDGLIYSLLKKLAINVHIFSGEKELFQAIYDELAPVESLVFYRCEYQEVIQRYHIRTLEDYLQVDRKGTGRPLNRNQRKRIWCFFEELLRRKTELNYQDYEDSAYLLYEALCQNQMEPLYDSIIIDEAQDLSPIKLKVLAKLVRTHANNLMYLSDQNQRIFNLSSWRKAVDVKVVGRTYYLNLNYRTTKQIKEYADLQFVVSENVKSYLRDYKSIMLGPEPIIRQCESGKQELDQLIAEVRRFLAEGVRPWEIGVLCPTDEDAQRIIAVLEYEELPGSLLKSDLYPNPECGICVATVAGAKGLEFKKVYFIGYNRVGKQISEEEHLDQHTRQLYLHQAECLKYVAATRAREELFVSYVG